MLVLVTHALWAFPGFRRPEMNILSADFWSNPFSIIKYTPLNFFASGTTALLVFFVLSGYVLVIALRGVDGTYRDFVMRRVARFIPPLLVWTLFIFALYSLTPQTTVPGTSDWFRALWLPGQPPITLIGHLLLLDTPEFNAINPVVWTLAHEMRIALIFPLIVWALLRDTKRTLLWSAVASVTAHAICWFTPPQIDTWLKTIHYALLFTAGAALAIHDERVLAFMDGLSRRARLAAWAAALTLLSIPIANWSTFYFAGPAAVALLVLCRHDATAQRLLSARLPVWLGRISYSLYLVHLPVMLATVHALGGTVPLPFALLAAATISIGLASAGHRFVERPAQRWGRRPSAPRLVLVPAE